MIQSSDHRYWLDKWERSDIGFHQPKPHPLLKQFFHVLQLAKNARVFVPLCGASIDMIWLLEQGYQVVGIELSELACESFFATHKLPFTTSKTGDFTLYQNPSITLICGDYFKLTRDLLGPVDAVYDRAALIALTKEQRAKYVQHLFKLVDSQTKTFIITIIYDEQTMQGPPFPVFSSEVQSLYSKHQSIKLIHEQTIKSISQHLQAKGLKEASEQVYCTIV